MKINAGLSCRQLTCSQEAYLADVSIRCSNPPQGEMKRDCKYSALYKLSRLRTYGKPILALVGAQYNDNNPGNP